MDVKGPVDVRIIVEGASDVSAVSKALQKVSLGAKYHITISSIIPTTSPEIATKAVEGADIVLIATDVDQTGRELADKFSEALKGVVGHVERVKLPYGHDVEYLDPELIREEIENAIIRAGLSTISSIKKFGALEDMLEKSSLKIDELTSENSALKAENKDLSRELEGKVQELDTVRDELVTLKSKLDEIKKENSELKARFSELQGRNLLETFSIGDLWMETFNEEPEDMEQIYFVTDHIKPEGIILGQGYIAAPSRDDAVEWLKIIKSALVFISTDEEDELKE